MLLVVAVFDECCTELDGLFLGFLGTEDMVHGLDQIW